MGADLAETPLYVSIRNYFSRLPYVDASGLTTLNLPVESVDVTDIMYEAKVAEIPTAKIVLPSLIAEPGLRPLLQNIKEGDRVEIFNFQPDCGDPVFAGFIPPEGIEEQDGKTILNVQDTQVQLRWQHIRRLEYYNTNADGFYRRAMSIWQDLVNTDFTEPSVKDWVAGNPNVMWFSPQASIVPTGGSGFVRITTNALNTQGRSWLQPRYQGDPGDGVGAGAIYISPGDAHLMEADVVMNNSFLSSSHGGQTIVFLLLQRFDIGAPGVGGLLTYRESGIGAFPQMQASDILVIPPSGPQYNSSTANVGTYQVAFPMPQSHHLAVFLHFNFDSTVTVYVYLDNVQVAFITQPWFYDATAYTNTLYMESNGAGDTVTVSNWRCRKLIPILQRAGRFNPQTSDAVTYQPNNEENLQLLQLFAQKDNAEYRPIYHAWPQGMDELELDLVGTLGKHASAVLGYEQPPALPTEGSPQASPLPVITDLASFLIAPPFRFEEGFNLEAAPRIQPKANAHSNDIIRVGASTQDAQVFAEKWAIAETGRPQQTPSGAAYPYFEQITNDDRVGIQALNATLAGFDVIRGTDPTPSLELLVVDELPWAFRWRVGDFVWVKTLSLRNNVEQEMRIVKNVYKAGSPLRTLTLGKTDLDPSQQRLFRESMMMTWLYEQSGTNPGIYVYPSVGNINSGVTSAVFSIPLDAYTTGSALVYAALHWFADANVMNIQPQINGAGLYTTGIAGASGTDSGLVICTQYFQSPGTYQLAFKNTDGSTRNLIGAFLVLRIKY